MPPATTSHCNRCGAGVLVGNTTGKDTKNREKAKKWRAAVVKFSSSEATVSYYSSAREASSNLPGHTDCPHTHLLHRCVCVCAVCMCVWTFRVSHSLPRSRYLHQRLWRSHQPPYSTCTAPHTPTAGSDPRSLPATTLPPLRFKTKAAAFGGNRWRFY